MRNFFFFLIIFLLIIIGLSPGIDGYLFKRNFYHLVEIINISDKAKVDVLSYQDGWFTSHAKIRVTPNIFNGDPNSPYLVLEHYIAHGPILRDIIKSGFTFGYATVKTDINFSDVSKQFFLMSSKIQMRVLR